MENTQRQYWLLYRDALRIMKHGRLQAGVDKCLELLLEPELNAYLRVKLLTNVAESGDYERFPHKLQLIDEALQIAERLEQNCDPNNPLALTRIGGLVWRVSAAKESIEKEVAERQEADSGEEQDGENEEEEEVEEFVDATSSQEHESGIPEFVASQQSTSSESDIGLPANVVGSGGDKRKGIPVRASKKFGLNTPVTSDQAEAEAEMKDA